MRRRELLQTAGLAATGVGTLAVASGAAAAAAVADYAAPEDVTITFPESELETYEPRLQISHLEVEPSDIYGFKATSPEHDTDAFYYACEYPLQKGYSTLAPPLTDSHYGDHEWFVVFTDDSGDVAEVVYTLHHWIAESSTAPPLYESTHPMARVVRPWHNYVLTDQLRPGTFVSVENDGLEDLNDPDDGLDHWLEQGMRDNLGPGTVRDPWTMSATDGADRGHWWQESDSGRSFDRWYAEFFASVLRPILD